METIRLCEAVTDAPVKAESGKWRVIVAKPGKGSSATYSAEVLKRDAAIIIPEGAQSFINHGVDRDPTKLIGVFNEGRWDEEEQAVVAELRVMKHWQEFVEEVGPHVGMSLYAMGEADEDGNLVKFIEDSYNGADLVARPGLVGSGIAEKLYESAVNHDSGKNPSVENASAQDSLTGKDNKMDEKILEALEALTASVNSLKSAQETKAEETAQVEADEKAIEEAVEKHAAAVDAIESARADLLPSQVKSLLAEAKTGVDIDAKIEAAKALVVEMREDAGRVQESAGRVVGGSKYESAADLGKVFG